MKDKSMNISLTAKLKNYDEFISIYKEGDENELYRGESLLFYSLSNNDTESRYLITSFLLNKGVEVNMTNECGENLLHILLSRTSHNIKQTAELYKILIEKGVNINQIVRNIFLRNVLLAFTITEDRGAYDGNCI
jgi:ankyrin repeat protein